MGMNEQFEELGFRAGELIPAQVKNDPFPLMMILHNSFSNLEYPQSRKNDRIDFVVYVKNPTDPKKAKVERIIAQYIRSYEAERGEVVLCNKKYLSSNGQLPTKTQMIGELIDNLGQSVFAGFGNKEYKIISDKEQQLERQLAAIGFNAANLIKAAKHTVGDLYVVLPVERPCAANHLQPNQFISFVISIDDNMNPEKAEILGIRATLQESSAFRYSSTEVTEMYFNKGQLMHKNEMCHQLLNKAKVEHMQAMFLIKESNLNRKSQKRI